MELETDFKLVTWHSSQEELVTGVIVTARICSQYLANNLVEGVQEAGFREMLQATSNLSHWAVTLLAFPEKLDYGAALQALLEYPENVGACPFSHPLSQLITDAWVAKQSLTNLAKN